MPLKGSKLIVKSITHCYSVDLILWTDLFPFLGANSYSLSSLMLPVAPPNPLLCGVGWRYCRDRLAPKQNCHPIKMFIWKKRVLLPKSNNLLLFLVRGISAVSCSLTVLSSNAFRHSSLQSGHYGRSVYCYRHNRDVLNYPALSNKTGLLAMFENVPTYNSHQLWNA